MSTSPEAPPPGDNVDTDNCDAIINTEEKDQQSRSEDVKTEAVVEVQEPEIIAQQQVDVESKKKKLDLGGGEIVEEIDSRPFCCRHITVLVKISAVLSIAGQKPVWADIERTIFKRELLRSKNRVNATVQ